MRRDRVNHAFVSKWWNLGLRRRLWRALHAVEGGPRRRCFRDSPARAGYFESVPDARPRGQTLALASFALFAVACAGVEEGRTDAEVEQLRLGRVHVVLQAGADEPDDFAVSARFAFVRGLDEDFVRARIDMPVLPHDILQPTECSATDQLTSSEGEAERTDVRELVLVDAGDLRVQFGDERYEVPLSLVPDLLPYMSGVEYVMYSDELPTVPAEGGRMFVDASGSQSDELPPFSTEGEVPVALGMSLPSIAPYALVLRWQAADPEDTITLHITGLVGDEAVGAEITCLVSDAGRARMALGNLRALGLAPNADALRIEASRLTTRTFDAGDFAGSELVIERRESVTLTR